MPNMKSPIGIVILRGSASYTYRDVTFRRGVPAQITDKALFDYLAANSSFECHRQRNPKPTVEPPRFNTEPLKGVPRKRRAVKPKVAPVVESEDEDEEEPPVLKPRRVKETKPIKTAKPKTRTVKAKKRSER